MIQQHLETNRLILRRFTTDDIPAMYEINLDEQVSQYTGDGGVVDLDEISRRIREDVLGDYQKFGFGRMAVELKSTGQVIGFAGFKYLEEYDEVDLGYRFRSDQWGRGIATEACESLMTNRTLFGDFNEVIALVLPKNKASIRVLEKLHFECVGKVHEDDLLALKFHRHCP